MSRRAKIVATLGPASQSEEQVRRLIEAGMDVARLNFSHGTHADHGARIALIRRLSAELRKPVSILQDLQGPKMRVGELPQGGYLLKPGQKVILTQTDQQELPTDLDHDAIVIPMDVPDLIRSVVPGNHILLDDGQLECEVTGCIPNAVAAIVILGGQLTSHKGVNLPGAELNIRGFTEKDKEDLIFGLDQGVDYVAISFVRRPEDVQEVRQAILTYAPARGNTPIIAKLERPEAITNLHEIMHEADGVMVARGDLAVETSPSAVPVLQKTIISMANRHAKFVITATQMLDSMIHNPRPTRAEASDVANAVFDGTDAVMLSGETASGSYPVESVQMMATIVDEAELHFDDWGHSSSFPDEITQDDAVSLTRAARELAHDRNVAGIAVFTQSGKTALLMSKARPRVPILAFTPDVETYQRLDLYWGVIPYLVPFASTVETMLKIVDNAMVENSELEPGQQVVMISGFPVGAMRLPNFALLHTIGESVE
jgi:pyruvate kinase